MDIQNPIYTIPFRELVDKRATSAIIEVFDTFTIPASTEDVIFMRIVEIPLEGIGLTGYGPTEDIVVELADAPFTKFDRIFSGQPTTGRVLIDDDTFSFGYLAFSSDDAGKVVKIKYSGRGSFINAADVNELSTGELLRDGAVKPRHIYLGVTGTTGAIDFVFARDVVIGRTLSVGGDLNVTGDLNIEGVVNKSISEVIDFTDDILKLNSGATAPGPNVGLEVDRGGYNPQLIWHEDSDAWLIKGSTGLELLSISDNKTVKVCDGGLFKPPSFATDPIPTAAMIPGTYYCVADNQYKGIVSDGATGAKIVILG
jgi:hypothetical protein